MEGVHTEGGKVSVGNPAVTFGRCPASSFTRINLRTAPTIRTQGPAAGGDVAPVLSPAVTLPPSEKFGQKVSRNPLQGHKFTILSTYPLFIPSLHDFYSLCAQSVQGERQRQEINEGACTLRAHGGHNRCTATLDPSPPPLSSLPLAI